MYRIALFLLTVFVIIFGLHLSAFILVKKLSLKKNKLTECIPKSPYKLALIFTISIIFFVIFGNIISSKIIVNLSFMWIVLVLYLSLFSSIILLISRFLKIKSNTKLIIIFTLILSLFTYGIWNADQITIRDIELASNKITQDSKAVFISDIHIGSRSTEYFSTIINNIKEINPDYLLIGGDLIDMYDITPEDINIINSLPMPVYFIFGNHESYENINKDFFANITNLYVLDNNHTTHSDFQIIGLNQYNLDWGAHSSPSTLLENIHINNSKYSIVLIHEPNNFDTFLKKDINLVLSGHTHRGQIFPFNLITRIRYKYNYGLYDKLSTIIYTSSGVGTWGPKMRIGSKNEIIVFNFKPI